MALVRSALRLTRASGVLVQASRGMAEMPLTFAAPSQVFYNQQDVRQVDVPSFRSVLGPDSLRILRNVSFPIVPCFSAGTYSYTIVLPRAG